MQATTQPSIVINVFEENYFLVFLVVTSNTKASSMIMSNCSNIERKVRTLPRFLFNCDVIKAYENGFHVNVYKESFPNFSIRACLECYGKTHNVIKVKILTIKKAFNTFIFFKKKTI